MFIGALLSGFLADRYGRKYVTRNASFIQGLIALAFIGLKY